MSFISLFRFFLTWWGVFLLGALDSSALFFAPFGTDAVLVYLCARNRSLFWLYPLLTTAGSVVGAAMTYAMGAKIGDAGLSRLVAERRLERLRRRVKEIGAFALGLAAALPPPFPLTAFVLTSGALKAAVPSARIEYVEGAGHALFVDQADRFNALLENFIGSLTASGR